jgi:polyisoprenoid-binding protein YceI
MPLLTRRAKRIGARATIPMTAIGGAGQLRGRHVNVHRIITFHADPRPLSDRLLRFRVFVSRDPGLQQKVIFMFRKLFPIALSAALLAGPALIAPAHAQVSHDPAAVQEGAYSVEPNHTRVLFSVAHLGFTTWYGEFTKVSGSLDLNPKAVGKSTLEIHIPVDSVSTSNAKVDGELKSADWFDATQFPEMVFKADKITETGKGKGEVTGTLTLHGVTKPVKLAVKFNCAGVNPLDKKYTVGFEVSGKIKRSDFGVTKYIPLVGDDVDLIISAGFEHN